MIDVIHCAPNPHFGESKTLSYLQSQIEAGYHVVLTNYYLPDGNSTLELDLAIINRFGVYLAEVKEWYGNINADDIFWQQEGRGPVSSPITSIDRKAKVMHGYLSQYGLGRVSVTGLVILSRGTQFLIIGDPRRERVFGLDRRLIDVLTSGNIQAFKTPPLSRDEINRIRDTLIHNQINPDRKFIGKYQIQRKIREEKGIAEYEGQHVEINRRVRIKVFQVLEISSRKQLTEQERRFKRDIEALDIAGVHRNLVRAFDFFKDEYSDQYYYLILEWVNGEPLSSLVMRKQEVPMDIQSSWVKQLALGLDFIHKQGVVHRNINPENIYIAEDGSIKLGDFDFAKVPALGKTISVTGIPLIQGRYTAPEIINNPKEVDGRADIYSLGAVWYDLIDPLLQEKPISIEQLEISTIPMGIKRILVKMIASRRLDRFQNAGELLDALERV